jgi:hypothetical protein
MKDLIQMTRPNNDKGEIKIICKYLRETWSKKREEFV